MADWKSIAVAGAIFFILALIIIILIRDRTPIKYHDDQRQTQLWEYYKDYFIETSRGAITLAGIALKAVITINGAAAIALLAFISYQWAVTGTKSAIILPMVDAVEYLVWGVFLGALATGLGYLRMYIEGFVHVTQIRRVDPEPLVFKITFAGHVFQFLAIGFVVAAYILFVVGMTTAADAFRTV